MFAPAQWRGQGRSTRRQVLAETEKLHLSSNVRPCQLTLWTYAMKYCIFLSMGNDVVWFQRQHHLLNAGVKCFLFSFFLRTQSSYMWEPHQGPSCKEAKARCMFFLYTSYSCLVTPINPGINWTPTVVCGNSLSKPPNMQLALRRTESLLPCCYKGAHVLAAINHQL